MKFGFYLVRQKVIINEIYTKCLQTFASEKEAYFEKVELILKIKSRSNKNRN